MPKRTEAAADEEDPAPPVRRPKIKKVITKRIHILEWLPRYTRGDVVADFIAGITVGMTMIPQSIAYAGLAGLQPHYGLYTSFIGSFAYVFVGTVKEVSIGPTSLMSLLTFSYVVGYPTEYVVLLTFLAGCVEFAMGLFKLGFLMDFISPCLTSGFTSAGSVIIIVAQLKNFFGVRIQSHDTFKAIKEFVGVLPDIRFADTTLAVCSVAFLLAFKRLNGIKVESENGKKVLWFLSISKNAIVVLISSVIAAILYNTRGSTPFKLTGPVPKGLPDVSLPPFRARFGNDTVGVVEMVSSLGSGIVVIPVVAILANIAIAKAYSSETIVDASQEMMSLGLCNILGSFIKAMPSCGAFTRSAVASSSGVRTPLQGIYSGAVIMLALSFLAPYFFYIPKATLAAVLITAASSLIDYEILVTLWKCNKVDFCMTLMTFIIGVVVSVEMAIVVGALLNALILLKMWSRPEVKIEVRSTLKLQEYVYIKPALGLFYPAADYLTESVKKAHGDRPTLPIALDCSGFVQIDYSAAKTIENLLKTYNSKHVGMVLVNVNPRVKKTLRNVANADNLELCQSTEDIDSRGLLFRVAEEQPLVAGNGDRRYSTKLEDIRRGSLCDVE
ncbi:sodium-independent sulfate anion transporter [Cylas formicarius]|uniref:sodium-independent sulfate anion transporter n=1 Tax=Cylas formicarius TaxID=197179 RepID=UPI002958571E|nr:sodium-independent sulfate anion transporter [Cylas formicarius]